MVSFKKLFFATSLLLSGVTAAPFPDGTLNVATTEVYAVNDFALESRDLNTIDTRATTKPKPKCIPTKRNELERRVLYAGNNPNQVMENQWVDAMQIKNNGGKATVADLSGCTALFFYMDTTLRRVVHILCGNEEKDAETAAKAAAGSDSVTIGAATQANFVNAKNGVLAGKSTIKINTPHIYEKEKIVTDTVAVTLSGSSGATTITEGTGPRLCKQS